MTTFQIILLVVAGIFAYKIYEHVQTLEDEPSMQEEDAALPVPLESLLDEIDEAFEASQYDSAKSMLMELLPEHQHNVKVIKRLGFVTMSLEQDDEAVGYFNEALKLDTHDDTLHLALASLFRRLNRLEEAKTQYEAALTIDEAYAVTHFNFANLLVDLHETDAAKKHYERAIELDDSLEVAKEALQELNAAQS